MICPSCDGWGTYPSVDRPGRRCRTCKGSGHVRIVAAGTKVSIEPHRPLPGQEEIPFDDREETKR